MTHDVAPAVVGRRALMRTAVWTVPVVASVAAAPAFAASCGSLNSGYLDWSANYTRSSTTSGVATVPIKGGENVNVSMTGYFNKYDPVGQNFAVTDTQIGGTGKRGFSMFQRVQGQQYLNNTNYGQLVNISFSRKVYGLSFTMTDIDSATGDFIDAIVINSDGSWTVSRASGVKGAGTSVNDPLKPTGTNTAVDNTTGNSGNATITFTGPVSSINIGYWNQATSTGSGIDPDQAVYLGPFSFQAYLTSGC